MQHANLNRTLHLIYLLFPFIGVGILFAFAANAQSSCQKPSPVDLARMLEKPCAVRTMNDCIGSGEELEYDGYDKASSIGSYKMYRPCAWVVPKKGEAGSPSCKLDPTSGYLEREWWLRCNRNTRCKENLCKE